MRMLDWTPSTFSIGGAASASKKCTCGEKTKAPQKFDFPAKSKGEPNCTVYTVMTTS